MLPASVLQEDKGRPNLTSVFCTPSLVEEKKKNKGKSLPVFSLLSGIRTPMGKSNMEKQAEVPFEKF